MNETEVKIAVLCNHVKREIKKITKEIVESHDSYKNAAQDIDLLGFKELYSDEIFGFIVNQVLDEIVKTAMKQKTAP